MLILVSFCCYPVIMSQSSCRLDESNNFINLCKDRSTRTIERLYLLKAKNLCIDTSFLIFQVLWYGPPHFVCPKFRILIISNFSFSESVKR